MLTQLIALQGRALSRPLLSVAAAVMRQTSESVALGRWLAACLHRPDSIVLPDFATQSAISLAATPAFFRVGLLKPFRVGRKFWTLQRGNLLRGHFSDHVVSWVPFLWFVEPIFFV